MALIEVDPQKCTRDGLCVAECPVGLIRFEKGEDRVPEPVRNAETYCIACGHCVAVCPTGALSHRDMEPDQCEPVKPELLPGSEAMEHAIRSRRSVRTYRKRPVERELLERLVDVARHAPSGHNLQPVHWLVIESREEVRRLAGLVIDWMRAVLEKDPAFAANLNMEQVVATWDAGIDRICRGAPHLLITHAVRKDRMAPAACTLALSYLDLMAQSMGLGTCWAGYFNAAAGLWPPMTEALGLPEGHASFGTMMIGYPAFTYARIPLRKEARITWR